MTKRCVLYITNLPAPYKIDFFNQLSYEYDLHVLVERKTASDRDPRWITEANHSFDLQYLKGVRFGKSSRASSDVIHYLKRRYDAIIINGYASPTMAFAISYLSFKKIPFIISCDGMIPKNSNSFRAKMKRSLLKKAEMCLSSGKMNTQALLLCGVAKDKIREYPFSSVKDSDVEPSVPDKEYYKSKIGCKRNKLVLYVGQMIYRKGIDVLIDAFSRVSDKNVELMCVGGVPENVQSKDPRITFIDFKGKEELKDYYRAADIFVLPTREDIWGLVVNEAMAHGCPVITTQMCGAGIEMVIDGKNGFLISSEDISAITYKIDACLKNSDTDRVINGCLETARKYTIEKMAKRTSEIIREFVG